MRPTFTNLIGAALLSAAAVSLLAVSAAAGQPPQDPKTILDRVFSEAQAQRGEARFKTSCSSCHQAGEFVEPVFSARWEGQSVGDLYDYISNEMPENDPGGLKPEEYASVIAFFLGQNGYPVGRDDLPADVAVLKQIGIVPNPK
jgi:mono/diheme cytochrome c family protein